MEDTKKTRLSESMLSLRGSVLIGLQGAAPVVVLVLKRSGHIPHP